MSNNNWTKWRIAKEVGLFALGLVVLPLGALYTAAKFIFLKAVRVLLKGNDLYWDKLQARTNTKKQGIAGAEVAEIISFTLPLAAGPFGFLLNILSFEARPHMSEQWTGTIANLSMHIGAIALAYIGIGSVLLEEFGYNTIPWWTAWPATATLTLLIVLWFKSRPSPANEWIITKTRNHSVIPYCQAPATHSKPAEGNRERIRDPQPVADYEHSPNADISVDTSSDLSTDVSDLFADDGEGEAESSDQNPLYDDGDTPAAPSSQSDSPEKTGENTMEDNKHSDIPDMPEEYKEDSPAVEADEQQPQEYEDLPPVEEAYEDVNLDKIAWIERPDESFEDIGGYEDVKDSLTEGIIDPLTSDNELYERFNVDTPQGVLFHGPPGTGKTLFARALAHEMDRPFAEVNAAKVMSQYINKTPQVIEALLYEAHRRHGVLLIDEADQIMADRDGSGNSHAEDDKAVSTFLNILQRDGTEFFVVLTTNMKDKIDDAMLRPGRIEKHFEIDEPGIEGRYEILWTHIKNQELPTKLDEEDVALIGSCTEGATGADLEGYLHDAKINAIREDDRFIRLKHFPDQCLEEPRA